MDIKKLFVALVLSVPMSISSIGEAEAAIPIAKIIQEGVKKVIKAVDLMIQRLQNKTIWLQNAQKVLENKLNELKLKEIAEWTDKHKKLYEQYYEELWKVKKAIETYELVRKVMSRQVQLVQEYKRAWEILKKDNNFTNDELKYMYRVYSGILQESVKSLDQMLNVVNSFDTQMTDGKRLEIINQASWSIERSYHDLKQFNVQNIRLSLSRSKDKHEIETVKKIYGL
ncbi:conjugal transfer protein TraI [Chryseosolibacter indicus]|uniref:Conjugal transfer protein TraI n=1 Tax=Chryseosolibacter indicus TaxID=2782351 RepID=A0ABS5VZQ5_9BACT|nr:conjugal transfer protein TraI [Chryseosolibacter indicus]MBT1706342.1 conjugal transfer protein TraI [Chryseosolibacter indicus]